MKIKFVDCKVLRKLVKRDYGKVFTPMQMLLFKLFQPHGCYSFISDIIYIRGDLSFAKKLDTLIHELGHYFAFRFRCIEFLTVKINCWVDDIWSWKGIIK